MPHKLLVVDDDVFNLTAKKDFLEKHGYVVDVAYNGFEAVQKVSSYAHQYSLVILDYRMEGKDGATTAREILSITKDLYVLIHSGDDSREALQSTWDAGAVKFVPKGKGAEFFLETVREWVERYEKHIQPLLPPMTFSENEKLLNALGMAGRSPSMADIGRRINKMGTERSDLTVLIQAESGAGKELIARAIHNTSPRKNHRFVTINCAAIPENLIESEIFGHKKGAFSGADKDRIGLFETADHGTFFFDEIGDAPLSLQAKLLRAIQEGKFFPVGSNQEVSVDVRVIAATNVNLKEAVKAGRFREDLYYRLKGATISIPALRERTEDIEPLVTLFTETFNREQDKSKKFLLRTIELMKQYEWPGNVRELENLTRCLLFECDNDRVTPEQLLTKLPELDGQVEPEIDSGTDFETYRNESTKKYFLSILRSSKTKTEAAQKAGMAETTFRYQLRKHGIQDAPLGGDSTKKVS